MRSVTLLAFALVACSSPQSPPAIPAPPTGATDPVAAPTADPVSAPPVTRVERFATDTPRTTVGGATFVLPAGWTLSMRGPITIVEAPERGSFLVLVELDAKDADSAVAGAWSAYKPDHKWPLKVSIPGMDRDGWTDVMNYDYQVSPEERRGVGAFAARGGGQWMVAIYDVAQAVGEKRSAQIGLMFGKLLPKGEVRESFAGKTAHKLDAAKIAELTKFVESAMKLTGVPGVSFGLVQDGKVVFAGGVGVRELGKPAKVDGDTKYMIASNTKGLATLMLAKLVDAKRLAWESTATTYLPSFKLGDADTTSKVLVKHLICACTGLPRQDMEWLFEYAKLTPDGVMATLATMQPTSKFGELFQYSNPMAAAAGFIGGHVMFPKLELGAAYDKAMQGLVFDPLGMKSTTHDFAKGQRGNAATAHAPDIDGKPALAIGKLNLSVIALRPAGGAWSTVKDMLKYIQMELAEGALPNGKAYISKDALLARRAPQVTVSSDLTYGMGLMVDTQYGVSVVAHGGDMIGFHSDMMWLPEHGVGAVILTNGDPGWMVRSVFRRKLLEVLFDGKPEADTEIATSAKQFFDTMAADRKLLTSPADATEAGKLAKVYANASLGEITVRIAKSVTTFDFGEYASEVGTRKNPDGTMSFITTIPGNSGMEFLVGKGPKPTLVLRDPQHEYVFDAK